MHTIVYFEIRIILICAFEMGQTFVASSEAFWVRVARAFAVTPRRLTALRVHERSAVRTGATSNTKSLMVRAP